MSYLSNYQQQKHTKFNGSYQTNVVTPITPNQSALQVPFSPSLNYSNSFNGNNYVDDFGNSGRRHNDRSSNNSHYYDNDSNEYEYDDHANNDNEVLHVKFQGLKLTTTAAVTVISSLSDKVKTIDLSNNRIDAFPSAMKRNILGINLSHNAIQIIQLHANVYGHIIELNLSHNRIKKTMGLASMVSIEYLDLSNNYITAIEGTELMTNLKVLRLKSNLVNTANNLRLLSFNKNLQELDIDDNPIIDQLDNQRAQLLNMMPSLKVLCNKSIKLAISSNVNNYQSNYNNNFDDRSYSELLDYRMNYYSNNGNNNNGTLKRANSQQSLDNNSRANTNNSNYSQRENNINYPNKVTNSNDKGTKRQENSNNRNNLNMSQQSTLPRTSNNNNNNLNSSSFMNSSGNPPIGGYLSSFYLPNDADTDTNNNNNNNADYDNTTITNTVNNYNSNEMSNNRGDVVKRSRLPWRNPPNPMPRPFKNKNVYNNEYTPYNRSASPVNYNTRRSQRQQSGRKVEELDDVRFEYNNDHNSLAVDSSMLYDSIEVDPHNYPANGNDQDQPLNNDEYFSNNKKNNGWNAPQLNRPSTGNNTNNSTNQSSTSMSLRELNDSIHATNMNISQFLHDERSRKVYHNKSINMPSTSASSRGRSRSRSPTKQSTNVNRSVSPSTRSSILRNQSIARKLKDQRVNKIQEESKWVVNQEEKVYYNINTNKIVKKGQNRQNQSFSSTAAASVSQPQEQQNQDDNDDTQEETTNKPSSNSKSPFQQLSTLRNKITERFNNDPRLLQNNKSSRTFDYLKTLPILQDGQDTAGNTKLPAVTAEELLDAMLAEYHAQNMDHQQLLSSYSFYYQLVKRRSEVVENILNDHNIEIVAPSNEILDRSHNNQDSSREEDELAQYHPKNHMNNSNNSNNSSSNNGHLLTNYSTIPTTDSFNNQGNNNVFIPASSNYNYANDLFPSTNNQTVPLTNMLNPNTTNNNNNNMIPTTTMNSPNDTNNMVSSLSEQINQMKLKQLQTLSMLSSVVVNPNATAPSAANNLYNNNMAAINTNSSIPNTPSTAMQSYSYMPSANHNTNSSGQSTSALMRGNSFSTVNTINTAAPSNYTVNNNIMSTPMMSTPAYNMPMSNLAMSNMNNPYQQPSIPYIANTSSVMPPAAPSNANGELDFAGLASAMQSLRSKQQQSLQQLQQFLR